MKHYLIIDGGTTNLRVTLVDQNGVSLAAEKRSIGAAASAAAGNNLALRAAVGDCMNALYQAKEISASDISGCIAYGMITCASGLLEVPHLCAPARLEDFRAGLVSASFDDIAPFPITFIPGLKNFSGEVGLHNVMQMDMMRGEETEAIGFAQLMKPQQDCVLVLPGSHNKLISIDQNGCLHGCMTTISGELLSVLTHHTILTEAVGGSFVQPDTYDREMMLAGAKACRAGISRAAFSSRILRTLGGLPQEKVASFLLGTVLTADLDALKAFDVSCSSLYIAGKEPLQQALCDLFNANGYQAIPVDAAVTARIGITGAMLIAGWL
ncbi:MAG: 2-dehydro-3-deoxygalactonokinase [Clostridia bacterium]|nr:2-dehydro-3-deoxygalactonokinase [Clostridia bacterium]